jgi:hypothetical protein
MIRERLVDATCPPLDVLSILQNAATATISQ